MASNSLNLSIKPRGKPIRNLPKDLSTTSSSTGSELHTQLARLARTSPSRLRIQTVIGDVIPNSNAALSSVPNLTDGDIVTVKDLGPQIAWRTVFIVEYLGPILIHPLIYFLRPYLYKSPSILGGMPEPSTLQQLSMAIVVLHFVKRELETLFVHKFSASTMPAFNIFKNSAHYWLLSGLNIAYWTYSPRSPTQLRPFSFSDPSVNPIASLGLVLFVVGELLNLNSHIVLSNLRPKGTTQRGIPHGVGFSLVTCPNYLFEIISWVGVWLVNFSLSTGVFALVAGGQMAVWAMKKESRYRKEFGDKYKKKRFAMIPGII